MECDVKMCEVMIATTQRTEQTNVREEGMETGNFIVTEIKGERKNVVPLIWRKRFNSSVKIPRNAFEKLLKCNSTPSLFPYQRQ
jgi:hypothetical protein